MKNNNINIEESEVVEGNQWAMDKLARLLEGVRQGRLTAHRFVVKRGRVVREAMRQWKREGVGL